jgi:enoyl-CoA hydratase
VPATELRAETEKLALQLAAFPQACMRGDRKSAYEQWGMDEQAAMANELSHGRSALQAGETFAGASRFSAGAGRGGKL